MPRSGRASLAITRKVLEVYGDVCHLCGRPGATTRDHLIAYSAGGTDDLANLRPAHRSCNSKRHNRTLNGYGARITIVMGPPASGKTTYVREHAGLKDLVIDLDEIARALMPAPLDDRTHVYPEHVRHVAIGARAAAIERATRLVNGCHVWIIHAIPSGDDLAQYRMLRYELITIDPGRTIVEQRVRDERPARFMNGVTRWYDTHGRTDPVPPASDAPTSSDGSDW